MSEHDTCANCGWPADNCGLCYDFAGRLAVPMGSSDQVTIRPGCRICYTLQVLGRLDLAAALARRKGAVESRLRALRDATKTLESLADRLDDEIRKIP